METKPLTHYDLKVGNNLEYGYKNGLSQITEIGSQHIDWVSVNPRGFNKEFRPIPLSEEILRKMGIKLERSADGDKFAVFENLLFFIENDNNEFYVEVYRVSGDTTVKLQYVHELQNFIYELKRQMLTLKNTNIYT